MGTAACAGSGSSICTNTIGSYTCACKTGYSGTGFVCNGEFLSFMFSFVLSLFLNLRSFCSFCFLFFLLSSFLLARCERVHFGNRELFHWWQFELHQHDWFLHLCLQHRVFWEWNCLQWCSSFFLLSSSSLPNSKRNTQTQTTFERRYQ